MVQESQAGHGNASLPDFRAWPYYIETTAKVVDISAGEYVNIVLFDNGKIAAWGDNSRGVGITPVEAGPVPYYDRYLNIYYQQNREVDPWRFKAVVAGGHYVAVIGASGHAPINGVSTSLDGEVITWGSFDYNSAVEFGPNYRLGDERGAVGPFPNTVIPCPGDTSNPPPPPPYSPPYDRLVAGHIALWGLKADPKAGAYRVHGWGSRSGGGRDFSPVTRVYDLAAGYSQWGYGTFTAINVGGAEVDGAIAGFGGIQDSQIACPSSWGIPTAIPGSAQLPNYPTALESMKLTQGSNNVTAQGGLCYSANCDGSSTAPVLTAGDFQCFSNRYTAAMSLPMGLRVLDYANCDGSTTPPVLTPGDFVCFAARYAEQVAKPCP